MKTLKLLFIPAAFAALSMTVSTTALAGGADLYKSKTCWSCHGKDAKSPIMKAYPKLAGQNADYAFNQMKDIQSGKRNNGMTAAMKGITHLTTDEEKKAIAEWLATQ